MAFVHDFTAMFAAAAAISRNTATTSRQIRATAPPPARRASAVAVADAAMMMAVGQSARSARRCAITVERALTILDTSPDMPEDERRAAASVILDRCGTCRRCGI